MLKNIWNRIRSLFTHKHIDAAFYTCMFPTNTTPLGLERTINNTQTKERSFPFTGIVKHNDVQESVNQPTLTGSDVLLTKTYYEIHKANIDSDIKALRNSRGDFIENLIWNAMSRYLNECLEEYDSYISSDNKKCPCKLIEQLKSYIDIDDAFIDEMKRCIYDDTRPILLTERRFLINRIGKRKSAYDALQCITMNVTDLNEIIDERFEYVIGVSRACSISKSDKPFNPDTIYRAGLMLTYEGPDENGIVDWDIRHADGLTPYKDLSRGSTDYRFVWECLSNLQLRKMELHNSEENGQCS